MVVRFLLTSLIVLERIFSTALVQAFCFIANLNQYVYCGYISRMNLISQSLQIGHYA